jgi:hypothetical protein
MSISPRDVCVDESTAPEYWRVLFATWAELVERYCEATKGTDAPYWHGERPNVGLLAAAAWQAELISLEEFASRRGRRGHDSHGRCDLWVSSPELADGDAYEAKYVEVAPEWLRDPVEPALKEACGQVSSLQAPYYRRRFGLVFACVLVANQDRSDTEVRLSHAIAEARAISPVGLAWAFPEVMRAHTENSPWEGYSCPGVILLAAEKLRRGTA